MKPNLHGDPQKKLLIKRAKEIDATYIGRRKSKNVGYIRYYWYVKKITPCIIFDALIIEK